MTTGEQICSLSQWVDDGNVHRDSEAITWGRIAKVSEECGEAIAAFIGATGQNPRKGVTCDMREVEKELYDVALTALGAVAHLHNNDYDVMEGLREHVEFVVVRAGLETV